MRLRSVFLLFIVITFGGVVTCSAAQSTVNFDRNSIVARVDRGSITLDQVMEVFGPAYYEIINRARTKNISREQINADLQKAWDKAVNAAVRDEMFYQEALNDYENKFQQMVDSTYQSSAAQGNTMLRSKMEERMRRILKKRQDEQVERVISGQIKAAGGLDNLNNVLKSRGITYKDWKDRIVRKAFTYSYLYSVFEPLGVSMEPRPQQILNYYKNNIKDFTLPGDVIFDQILISNTKRGGKEKADEIAQKLGLAIMDKKISFAKAASKYSDDPVGRAGGGRETGVSQDPEREAWLSDVREAVREQTPGELEILESPRGYHLTVLHKVTSGRRIPYKKAQKSIVAKIKGDEWETQCITFYKRLKNRMMVDVIQKEVPPQLLWQDSAQVAKSRKIGMSADPTVNSR